MTKQVIECLKDYPMVGGSVKKGSILTENTQVNKESFDTLFISETGIEYHFDNSEIVFSLNFKKSFKLLKKI